MVDPSRAARDPAPASRGEPSERRSATSPPATIPARRLLGRADRVVIEHDGARYELRLTRNNKLILTK